MSRLTDRIKVLRERLDVTQSELASRSGMMPAQLCRIENGRTDPSIGTATRIAAALGVPLTELLAEPAASVPPANSDAGGETQGRPEAVASAGVGSVPIRIVPVSVEKAARKAVAERERRYDELDRKFGLSGRTPIQLVCPYIREPGGSEMLARALRASLGAGEVTFADLPGLLDLNGVRIHLVSFRGGEPSVSFYDLSRGVLSIAVQKGDTPERQTYRLAYELGAASLFVSDGFRTVLDEDANHRLIQRFAAAFLMPEDAVRKVVAQCGIGRRAWTMAALLALKVRFNVSAEAFALRLEELGLIAPTLRKRFRDDLRAHYVQHPKAMEPAPRLPSLRCCVRMEVSDLRESPNF